MSHNLWLINVDILGQSGLSIHAIADNGQAFAWDEIRLQHLVEVDITKFRPLEAARNLQQAGLSPVLTMNCEIHDLICMLQGIN